MIVIIFSLVVNEFKYVSHQVIHTNIAYYSYVACVKFYVYELYFSSDGLQVKRQLSRLEVKELLKARFIYFLVTGNSSSL